jgi:hypothetical protein
MFHTVPQSSRVHGVVRKFFGCQYVRSIVVLDFLLDILRVPILSPDDTWAVDVIIMCMKQNIFCEQ